MDQASQEGAYQGQFSFSPMFPPVNVSRARSSLIRAAYLAAFAVFGWPYILNRNAETLRASLKDPTLNSALLFINVNATASNDTRAFLIVTDPADLACVAVTIGKRTVMLPSPFKLVNGEQMSFEALTTSLPALPAIERHDQPQRQADALADPCHVHARVDRQPGELGTGNSHSVPEFPLPYRMLASRRRSTRPNRPRRLSPEEHILHPGGAGSCGGSAGGRSPTKGTSRSQPCAMIEEFVCRNLSSAVFRVPSGPPCFESDNYHI